MSETTSSTSVDYVNPALFTEIPENIAVPGNYVQAFPNYDSQGLAAFPARILLVAQMLAAGTAVANTLYPLLTPAQATNLCGAGSIGEAQAIALLATNTTIPIDIICVNDAAGATAAVGGFNFGGEWTTGGVVPLYIGGVQILVPVAATDDPAMVASNARAMIAQLSAPVSPVLASVGAGDLASNLILTSRHKCQEMNTLMLEVASQRGDMLPNGMTVTVVPMAGGTLNPGLQPVLNAIANRWYTSLVHPWQDAANATLLAAYQDSAYTATSQQDMYSFGCVVGTYAAASAVLGTLNSRFRTVMVVSNPRSPHWAISASMCGVASQIWFTDPSQQVKDQPLPGIVPPHHADYFPFAVQNLLVPQGGSIYGVLADGTMVIKRLVSENTTDDSGTPTTAWQDPMAAQVETRIRYDWKTYLSLTYPDNKLADDGSLAAESNPNIATPNRVRGSWASRCTVYGQLGWIEDVQNQCRKAQFVRDPNSRNRLNEVLYYQRVGNLMVTATALLFEA